MVERIDDMPAGTIGLRASGKLTREDYPEDLKTGLSAWFGHHSAWKRFALVTDVDWVARAMHMFAWMTPGDVMITGLDKLGEARAWVAG